MLPKPKNDLNGDLRLQRSPEDTLKKGEKIAELNSSRP
jgi:hypothetical protein